MASSGTRYPQISKIHLKSLAHNSGQLRENFSVIKCSKHSIIIPWVHISASNALFSIPQFSQLKVQLNYYCVCFLSMLVFSRSHMIFSFRFVMKISDEISQWNSHAIIFDTFDFILGLLVCRSCRQTRALHTQRETESEFSAKIFILKTANCISTCVSRLVFVQFMCSTSHWLQLCGATNG